MDWIQVVVNLILTGVLLYVFQRIIDERSARRLEQFKAELQSTAFEKETQFSKLHEIRVEVVAELYKKLSKIHNLLQSTQVVLQFPDYEKDKLNQKLEKITEINVEFRDYLAENKIYITENLHDRLFQFSKDTISAKIILGAARSAKELNDNSRLRTDLLDSSLMLTNKITPLKLEIESQFRDLLGGKP